VQWKREIEIIGRGAVEARDRDHRERCSGSESQRERGTK
jgi:hypothetical protein